MLHADRVDEGRRPEHPLVVPLDWAGRVEEDIDERVCPDMPDRFSAIRQGYHDFAQTTDMKVISSLERATLASAPRAVEGSQGQSTSDPLARNEDIEIVAGRVSLAGYLAVPSRAPGIVVFAHGSGSSRFSSRNRFVAGVLNQAGLGTLLFDLLTVDEEADRTNVFDIELLAGRLVDVTRWLATQPEARGARIGYFGASTGAAAALWAAADVSVDIDAVVSRGGRPDLAGLQLSVVTAPTLLIVGSRDDVVLRLNREAQARLTCENRVAVVPGATHLFEEPGTLRVAAELARDWFLDHLAPAQHRSGNEGSDDLF